MTDFRMPSLGADMEDGKLVEWLKRPGDSLKRGDIIAVVETQKGAIEIEAFLDGVLERTVAEPGTTLPVGAVLAVIRTAAEKADAGAVSPPPPAEPPPSQAAVMRAPPGVGGARATPAARRDAERRNIDLASVKPGPDGIVGLRELGSAGAGAPRPRGVNFEEMRKAIGAAMARSKREIPHYYVSSAIDLTSMTEWLAKENASRPVTARLLPLAPLLKACALALTRVPELNGHYVDGRFIASATVKMGVGIAMRGGGLIAPAIDGADGLRLDDLMARLADLTARVRGGRLRSSELTEATVTLSSLGDESADTLFPVIYPPQVAIIGVGQITETPRAIDGAVAIRKIANVTLAGDHRVNDGRSAARFLRLVQSYLQKPEAL